MLLRNNLMVYCASAAVPYLIRARPEPFSKPLGAYPELFALSEIRCLIFFGGGSRGHGVRPQTILILRSIQAVSWA